MSVRFHLFLMIFCEFAGFLVGGILVVYLFVTSGGLHFRFLQIVTFFAIILVGTMIPRLVFRNLIPAKCPACGEKAYAQGANPVRYVCRSCGHREDTAVFEDTDRPGRV
jgi:hypothetical protein